MSNSLLPSDLSNYPELLENLFTALIATLEDLDVEPPIAEDVSWRITEFIRENFGGRQIRIPQIKKRSKSPVDTDTIDMFADLPSQPEAQPVRFPGLAEFIATIATISSSAKKEIVDMVEGAWRGENLYFPKGRSYKYALRDYEIWRAWDKSHRKKLELMEKYNICEGRFYQIIRKVQALEDERTQPSLAM